jgi:predicted DNA-binding transcriptional regulator AlpA
MEILTVAEVAALLKISQRTVREWCNSRAANGDLRSNPIPAFRVGKCIRFRKEDVEVWIEKLAVPTR